MDFEFDRNAILNLIHQQTTFGPRRPGSPGGHLQEDFLEERLRAFGFPEVRREAIPITYWETEKSALQITSPAGTKSVECFPIPYSRFTNDGNGEGDLSGRLVLADESGWQRADWRDAIVVAEIRFPELKGASLLSLALGKIDEKDSLKDVQHPATWVRLGWHLYRRAVAKGARGFIGIIRDQPGATCRMYAPYGFREKDILDKPLPGVWVSSRDGEFLNDAARSGQAGAVMISTGIRKSGVTHNIIAELPGETDETMILTCHHDSPFRSPVEDGSGVAVVLALAGYFAKQKNLKRRLRVLLTAGHFYGSIGTRTYIAKHAENDQSKIVFVLSVEHIAKEARTDGSGKLVPTGLSEAAGIFVSLNKSILSGVLQAAENTGIDRCLLLPAEGPLGDYPPTDAGDWHAAGVPIVNYISNPVYLLTDDDADHWVNESGLVPVTETFKRLLQIIDKLPTDALKSCDYPFKLFWMKFLRLVMQAKTTRFGRQPVH